MNNKDRLYRKIKLKKKLIKIRLYCLMVLASPILAISFVFAIIFHELVEWKDRQYQKIEDARIDLVYLRDHGKTYKEYYNEI